VVRYGLRHRDLSGIQALGVDEVCVAKGKLWTVVYQIDQGARRLLWIGIDRKAATLEMIFNRLGRLRGAAVEFICSDMWRGYLGVIARRLPQALHILDRFHIRKNLGEAIDQIRRAESPGARWTGAPAQEAALGAAQAPAQLDRQGAGADAGVARLRVAQLAGVPAGGNFRALLDLPFADLGR
jgi:transposase